MEDGNIKMYTGEVFDMESAAKDAEKNKHSRKRAAAARKRKRAEMEAEAEEKGAMGGALRGGGGG